MTLPLAAWAARRARFETLLGSLASYFAQAGALPFLAFIVLYKLGDAFAGSLLTPFLLQAMHYSTAEVGVVNKVIGLWLTIAGALVGGALMIRLGLWRSLMLFGVLQMLGNLGFWWLALHGRDALPGIVIPAFDWGFVKLAAADAGRRRPADGDRQREHHQRHGHGGVRRLPDEPVQPALQRDPVRAAQRLRVGRPGLGRAAGRRAGAVDRLAGVLPRLDRRRTAGAWPCCSCCARRSTCSSAIRRIPMAVPDAARAAPLRRERSAAGAAALAVGPALGREGVDVGPPSALARLVPAEQIERAAAGQYLLLLRQNGERRSLAPAEHPQLRRLRYIAERIIPFTYEWNPRARQWQWEVNLIGSKQINAFCMPGGKIAFFYGILQRLQLSDDEVAMVMGHEMTHACASTRASRSARTWPRAARSRSAPRCSAWATAGACSPTPAASF